MKKIYHILLITLLFSNHSSYSMEQPREKMNLILYTVAGCASLYIMKYHIFPSFAAFFKRYFSSKDQPIYTPQSLSEMSKTYENNSTALHEACDKNDVDAVRALLQKKSCDINAKRNANGEKGETALHIACRNRNTAIVELLLEYQADVNTKDKEGNTPLLTAYTLKAHEIVQKLLTCPAIDINQYKKNCVVKNLLSLACRKNDIPLITQLLNRSDIKIDTNYYLVIACKNGFVDLVALLLSKNTKNCMQINENGYRGRQPLFEAYKALKKYESTRSLWSLFLENICNKPDTTGEKWFTIIKMFIDNSDMDLSTAYDHSEGTVFHMAADDPKILKLCLEKDARAINNEEHSEPRNTPLHDAMCFGNIESIFLMLQYGADIKKENSEGISPLAKLCTLAHERPSTHLPILEQLLQSAYVNKDIINQTHALLITVFDAKGCNYHLDVVTLLLKNGADPNQKIENHTHYFTRGFSPLLQVAQYNLSLLNLCIDSYKGNIAQYNNEHKTALYLAFMAEKINTIHQINFFARLSDQERNNHMQRELEHLTYFTPDSILPSYCSAQNSTESSINKQIKRFYLFVEKCITYGKIDINQTKLLTTIYQQIENRDKNFEGGRNCMLIDNLECLDDKKSNPLNTYCQVCRYFHSYNELITHAFVRCIQPISNQHKVDKIIANTYKEKPTEYYLLSDAEKNQIKLYIKQKEGL